MSSASIGSGYCFGFQAMSISPASLKRAEVRNFSTAEKFSIELMRYKNIKYSKLSEIIAF